MGNYIRAFCVGEEVPSVTKLVQWLATRDVAVKVENGDPLKMQSRGWEQVSLVYKEGKLPIIARCSRTDAKGNGSTSAADSAADELKSFIERVGAPGKNKTKKRIVDHLKATRFIVALRLPKGDMDDAGWDANGQILTYFLDHCGALIQADGEGFYEGSKLILEMAEE
jgi:hypothetical protein